MIRAVIFDCFGVLVGASFDETYRRAGGDPEKDALFIDDALAAANLGIITPDEMRTQMADHMNISENAWQSVVDETQYPNPEVLAFAESLKNDYKIGILSNANVGTLERKFTPEQLAMFDAIVVSAEVRVAKPDPRIYEMAAVKLGLEANECVFIDDIESFCEAARGAGMQAVRFQNLDQCKRDVETLLHQD